MTVLSPSQIGSAMASAGWSASAIPVGIAIALAESGGNASATHKNSNGSTDYGLFQINSVHAALLASGTWSDPVSNAKMALQVYKDAGNSWRPWTTYTSGAYQGFTSAAAAYTGGGGTGAAPLPDTAVPKTPIYSGGILGADPLAGLTALSQTMADIYNAVTSAAFWHRVLMFVLGAALIIAGVVIVFRKQMVSLTPAGGVAGLTKTVLSTAKDAS